MAQIGRLMCGAPAEVGIARTALEQLANSIDFFGNHLANLMESRTNEATAGASAQDLIRFGPFCARIVLENSCAALMGRLDPFRMMYISEFQAQPEYEPGKRAKSSFAWSGDVMPLDANANQTLWNIDYEISRIGRALLSKHFDHICWKPAVDKMIDYVSTVPRHPILSDILQVEADSFLNSIRGRAARLHSTLSKGVHWEFFNSVLISDEVTVRTSVKDTINIVADLGLVSHFIPTAYSSLTATEATNLYIEVKGAFNE